jgi:Arc/MetJ-type ribon-helix-helix transcriptional regulator
MTPVHRVRLRLNQQQLELIDNSVAAGRGKSRDDLIRRALREFAAVHLPAAAATAGRDSSANKA